MDGPFEINVDGVNYSVYPDLDDFIGKMIYGIEFDGIEVGILLVNDAGLWEWTEGGSGVASAAVFGEEISAVASGKKSPRQSVQNDEKIEY